jgi:hypothetical protein
MQIIMHRRNTIKLLADVPEEYGVEVDIRSHGDNLILHHDPFERGVVFERWLEYFKHQTLILNVKEEGLEDRLEELMCNFGIGDYFYLDQSFPFLVKTSSKGESRSAVRVSEYEGFTCARALAGKVQWVWVDCFNTFPLTGQTAGELKELGFKLCIVSPELQGRPDEAEVVKMRAAISDLGVSIDAVCTKVPSLW